MAARSGCVWSIGNGTCSVGRGIGHSQDCQSVSCWALRAAAGSPARSFVIGTPEYRGGNQASPAARSGHRMRGHV